MQVETIGDVLFSLAYIPQSECIQGTLLKAANLKAQDVITGTAGGEEGGRVGGEGREGEGDSLCIDTCVMYGA